MHMYIKAIHASNTQQVLPMKAQARKGVGVIINHF